MTSTPFRLLRGGLMDVERFITYESSAATALLISAILAIQSRKPGTGDRR